MRRTAAATCPIVRSKQIRPALAGAFGLALLITASGVQAQLFKDDALYERVRQLEGQRGNDAKRVDGIETGIATRTETQGRMLLDVNAQLDSLKQEIARLRGQIEVLTNELENSARRQKDFYVDLDGRLRRPRPKSKRPTTPG